MGRPSCVSVSLFSALYFLLALQALTEKDSSRTHRIDTTQPQGSPVDILRPVDFRVVNNRLFIRSKTIVIADT